MSDLKLFRIKGGSVTEVERRTAAVEKSLQAQIEQHMDELLGVRFLATEYYTGEKHRGRIDSLGLDENGAPVIVEYKRAVNANIISQGLFYLVWLLDHKGAFQLLVQKKLGLEVSDTIDWNGTRIICIAGGYTHYDLEAVQKIDCNIQLIRYGRYGEYLLALELVNAKSASEPTAGTKAKPMGKEGHQQKSDDMDYRLQQANGKLLDLYEKTKAFLLGFGEDVQFKKLQNYHAFKRIKNFACVEIYPQVKKVTVFVKVDPKNIPLEKGFTRDVSEIGHFGTGNLEITIKSNDDLQKAESLLRQSYENS